MPLTRDFRETIQARAQRDSRFREALNAYLAGDTVAGKAKGRGTRAQGLELLTRSETK